MTLKPKCRLSTLRRVLRVSLPACCLLVAAFCFILFPANYVSPQVPEPSPSPSPTATPTPTPSPSPTPVTGLHQWGAVTLFHGLPSDRVRAIAQGSDGMMWFGTEAGLAKFDGRRTQTFVDPDMPTGRVLALHTDSRGALWVGTDNGAARIAGGEVNSVAEAKGQTVNVIIEPSPGRLIMATEQGMIYECNVQNDGSFQGKPLLAEALISADADRPGPLPITSLALVNGKLIAGSLSRGLLLIENNSATTLPSRRPHYFVRALEIDARGKVWAGTKGKKTETALHVGDDLEKLVSDDSVTGTVMVIQIGLKDDMWVGTEGNGVFYFPSSGKPTRYTFDGTAGGLRSDSVFAIFIDREDVVWFGTDRGVSRLDLNAPKVETIGDSADSNFVRTLYQTNEGHILAGTNRGLFVYDAKEETWNVVQEMARQSIYSIAQDGQARLLVGSANGFYTGPKLSRDTAIESQSFSRITAGSGNTDGLGSIRGITTFRGAIYIANFGRGVERFDDNRITNIWPADATFSREVTSLQADGDRLLIGTAKDGVLTFDGTQLSKDPLFEPMEGSTVRSILPTSDGVLWVATNQGVYLCRPNDECVPAAPGYEARSLTSGLANGKDIWCATTGSGLLRIRLDEQFGPVVSQLDAEQGLPSQNVFASLPQTDAQGVSSLLIGTSRGVARYRPATVVPTLYASRVISKRVHSPGELQSGLYLEYPQNSLLLDVAAVSSRTFPEKFQYAFALANASGRVIKQKVSRESQFTMEGLSPGNYQVTARAFNRDLVSSEPMTFGLTIAKAPFPWTSTALAILLALALLALLWAILERRRIARTSAALIVANRELAGARLDLANEAERERRRIARDLHDQTLADLRHLMLLSDQVSNGAGVSVNDKPGAGVLRTEIESISQEVRRICEDLSPSVLQNVGFAAALEFALSHAVQDAPAAKRFEYDFICDEGLDDQLQLPANVQMQIYRIVQEAVNNIWRHAGATRVIMEVHSTPLEGFVLTIEDNGLAFEPKHDRNDSGRGLANMRARASLIGADIDWSKSAGGGTLFTLRLPVFPSATGRGSE